MTEFKLTNKLIGDYGEIIFEHFCQENGYAYITLEEIYNTLTPRNILKFRHGYHRIKIQIPDDSINEIRRICKPSNSREEDPSFVFDYMTIYIKENFNDKFSKKNGIWVPKPFMTKTTLNWVEIKTRGGFLSDNQKRYVGNTKICLWVFKIETELPEEINVHLISKDTK